MHRFFLVLLLFVGLAGCGPSQTDLHAQRQAAQENLNKQYAEMEGYVRQIFSEAELLQVENVIRSQLAYPASAKFSQWMYVGTSADDQKVRTGTVAVEATNVGATRRVHKMYIFQAKPNGTVVVEPYVRGM